MSPISLFCQNHPIRAKGHTKIKKNGMVATHLWYDIIFPPRFIAVKDQIKRKNAINHLKTLTVE